MWKIVKILIVILIQVLANSNRSFASNHSDFRRKYPYALLGTDSWGILNESDLASGQCTATPTAFSEKKTVSSYPYWKCYEPKNLNLLCDDAGIDESIHESMAILIISLKGSNEKNQYLSRKGIPTSSCLQYRKDLLKIARGEKSICLSGPYIEYDLDKFHKKTGYWTFDKAKTKKGCVSYFEGDCGLSITSKECNDS